MNTRSALFAHDDYENVVAAMACCTPVALQLYITPLQHEDCRNRGKTHPANFTEANQRMHCVV